MPIHFPDLPDEQLLGALACGTRWPLTLRSVSRRRRLVAHQVSQARRLLRRAQHEPEEQVVPAAPDPDSAATISGLPISRDGLPTLAGIKVTYNEYAHGLAAGDYLKITGYYLVLEPQRQKEIDLVMGLERGSLVLVTSSSKSATGARLVGLAFFLSAEVQSDGSVAVECQPLKRFHVPLPSGRDRRPARLTLEQTCFGPSFSGKQICTPATASDLLGLYEVLGWPERVLSGDFQERLDGLFTWAQRVDQDQVEVRWRQAAAGAHASPLRAVLGGVACFVGRAGELIVADLLERLFPHAVIADVCRRPGEGCDLIVRVILHDRLKVEVKTTRETVYDPAAWARNRAGFKVSQRRAAERSLERGGVPWVAAVVSEVLTDPKVTFLGASEVFPHLAARVGEELR